MGEGEHGQGARGGLCWPCLYGMHGSGAGTCVAVSSSRQLQHGGEHACARMQHARMQTAAHTCPCA
eukprot:360672-Chlamydomonas_euryale.AAC.19